MIAAARMTAFVGLTMFACASYAADRPSDRAEKTAVLPEYVTSLSFGEPVLESLVGAVNTVSLTTPGGRSSSAGVAPSLPDLIPGELPYTQLPFYLFRFRTSTVTPVPDAPVADRVTLSGLTQGLGVIALVASSPLGGVARRIGAQKFNTDDGSMMYDFAICYRLNRRSSIEVVPGDPAPVKLPVVTMQNNMGVTVGMVVRLNRQR